MADVATTLDEPAAQAAEAPITPPKPPPPVVSSGTVTEEEDGSYTWVPDPTETYSDAWEMENGVRRRRTQAEYAALAPAAPTIPAKVQRYQARGALYAGRSGGALLEAVDAAVDQAGGLTQIWWREAPDFLRADPRFDAIGAGLGLAPADIDALFVLAATL